MPIDTYWHDDARTILVYDFKDTWTLDEFHVAIDSVVEMLSGYTGRLDGITDMNDAQMARGTSAGAMQVAWNRSYKILPEEYRLAVVVGAGMMLELFLKTFGKVYAPIRNHVRAAGSFEDALELIQSDRIKDENKREAS